MGVYCAVYGCLSSSKNDKDRSFFRFPRNESRCKQWIQATNREDLKDKTAETLNKSYFICDNHFQESDRLVKKLKINAVPTLNLPHQENVNPTKSTQTIETMVHDMPTQQISETYSILPKTDPDAENTEIQSAQNLSTITSCKRNFLSEAESECKRQKIVGSRNKCAIAFQTDYKIPPVLRQLLHLQNQLKHNRRDNKYNRDFKLFSLNVFLASPLAYRVLAKTLNFPSRRILHSMNIKMGTRLYPNVLKCLERKLKNQKQSEKYCVICADEMSLKRHLYYQINDDKIVGLQEIDGLHRAEPATQAFVVMARGIFSKWIQPLAYCFLGKSKNYTELLNKWLDDVIAKILNIGFHVVALVSDQSSIFLNLAKERNVSADQPYFFINDKKLYYIFDVPHLMKSVRNKLMKYDFTFLDKDGNNHTAKWEHIQILYQQDCERAYRLAPKLTQSHITPNDVEKIKVNFTTEMFSSTVAAAMNCSMEFGLLQKTCLGTVTLIELMDRAFDVLNSSVVKDCNKYKSAFNASPHQIEVLDRLDSFLSNVIVYNSYKKNVTKAIHCLKGLKITLNSIKGLSHDLHTEGFGFLFTRRLNQEPLEIFLGSVGKHYGICGKPTPIQFSRAFKKFFMVNILKHSEHSKCLDDLDKLLINIDDVSNFNFVSENEDHHEENTPLSIAVGTVDYRFDLPENNAFVYVCGYLLKKCFDIHKCKGIKQYVKNNNKVNDGRINKCESFGFINPPESFVTYIEAMDEKLKLVFENKYLDNVGNEILNRFNDIILDDCCPCFPNIFVKKLFIRLRIFQIIRFNNKQFRDKAFNPKYFSVNNIL